MELINQHTKAIMEGCKERARAAGLRFQDESLEYIVTNRDLLELSPKVMIPTLYDYWVHDVEVLREKGRYELYPGNPYETVINTRPAISFYNDNNPDWLNVMIFYHVLGHIDFFQNNVFFRHTWDYDFTGTALSDKRMIAKLRAEKGRWLDYVIEFSRSIDNLVAYHAEVGRALHDRRGTTTQLDYYLDTFLQKHKKVKTNDYIKEVERYNQCCAVSGSAGEQEFFAEVHKKYPEFETMYHKNIEEPQAKSMDLLEFLMAKSKFLNKGDNQWMKSVMQVVRKTSLFFQPQIRTKILNEGWASYWHETLFLSDERIKGHEVNFARVNAGVTAMPRVGLNPYALGMRLFYYLEDSADKGKYSFEFNKMTDRQERCDFDKSTGRGREFIFQIRENCSDSQFIRTYLDQDFVDLHKIFVAGRRLNQERMTWQYYVKSRKAEEYRRMVEDSLYHPPHMEVSIKEEYDTLYLKHRFESKPLVREFISNTMMGIEFLWGGTVQLETNEPVIEKKAPGQDMRHGFGPGPAKKPPPKKITWRRVLYTMKNRKLSKTTME